MVKDADDGRKPLQRPKYSQKVDRIRDKRRKKNKWATRGGCIAPIIIPPTPHSELLHMLQEVAKAEALPGLKFKVVEGGGKTVKRAVQNSNPTASGSCKGGDCMACNGGQEQGGHVGNQIWCTKSNVNSVQQTNKQSMWVKQPGIYTPVAENTKGTIRKKNRNHSCTGTSKTIISGLKQNLKQE